VRLDDLAGRLPDAAKDLRLNAGAVLRGEALTEQQTWLVALASALVTRHAPLVEAVGAEARERLSAQAWDAGVTAASLMGMNNVYYRFTHLVENEDYARMPAGLRMNGLRGHGVEEIDFELACLAVSAIHGCGMCVDSHEKTLVKKGATTAAVQAAVKIASVLHGVAVADVAGQLAPAASAG